MSDTSAVQIQRRAGRSCYLTPPNSFENEKHKSLSPGTLASVEDTTRKEKDQVFQKPVDRNLDEEEIVTKALTSSLETNAAPRRTISKEPSQQNYTPQGCRAVARPLPKGSKTARAYPHNLSPPRLSAVQPAAPFMPPSGPSPVRLFVASIGNPPPYHSTRHSAGHILLKRLQSYLSLPPLTKSKAYGSGHVSLGVDVGVPQWTLWQSDSLMNVSGVNLTKAYKTFLAADAGNHTSQEEPRHALVILHDEMETEPKRIKLRRGPTSPKGHNGIKSVQQSLQSAGLMDQLMKNNLKFLKVGIGIGRPYGKTRDKDDVSTWVLGQLGREEREGIEESVGELVEALEAEVARIGK